MALECKILYHLEDAQQVEHVSDALEQMTLSKVLKRHVFVHRLALPIAITDAIVTPQRSSR